MVYLHEIVLASVRSVPGVGVYLAPEIKAASLQSINKKYHDAITRALVDYFEGGGIVPSRNKFKQAALTAFVDTFDLGWVDGGAELPIDEDAADWFEGRANEEMANIDALYQTAAQLRKDKEYDYFAWITARADGYVSTLQSIYNYAIMMANGKQMLTWNLGETEKHCTTCLQLNGKRHKASWYIERDYIPRKPAAAMECNGYNCDCYLTNDKGDVITVG